MEISLILFSFILLASCISYSFNRYTHNVYVEAHDKLYNRIDKIVELNDSDTTRTMTFNLKSVIQCNNNDSSRPVGEYILNKNTIYKVFEIYRTIKSVVAQIVRIITTIKYLKGGFLYETL